jgi:hypothetical protein
MIPGCENTDACGTRTASPASVRVQRYTGYSVTPRPESSASIGGGKNRLRRVWPRPSSVLRPQAAPSTRPAVRGHAGLPGAGGPARRVQALRQGEAGATGLAGGQSVLHQALRRLRGAAVPSRDHQGRRPRNAPGLEDGQGTGNAVHAGTAAPGGDPGSRGDRGRRDLDPEGAHLPHRGQRPAAPAANPLGEPDPSHEDGEPETPCRHQKAPSPALGILKRKEQEKTEQ